MLLWPIHVYMLVFTIRIYSGIYVLCIYSGPWAWLWHIRTCLSQILVHNTTTYKTVFYQIYKNTYMQIHTLRAFLYQIEANSGKTYNWQAMSSTKNTQTHAQRHIFGCVVKNCGLDLTSHVYQCTSRQVHECVCQQWIQKNDKLFSIIATALQVLSKYCVCTKTHKWIDANARKIQAARSYHNSHKW